jgi:hypothetical protein
MVQGAGCRVQDSRVQGSKLQASGFRVPWCRVEGLRVQQGSRVKPSNSKRVRG